jgi:hypothetical protein
MSTKQLPPIRLCSTTRPRGDSSTLPTATAPCDTETFLKTSTAAEWHGKTTELSIEALRLAVLMFIETVIILDAAVAQVAGERLSGQSVLFRDTAVKLAEQLQMATDLSTWFNELAVEVGDAEINLEELRNSLQSETDRRISTWVSLARMEMLSLFGKTEELHAAPVQGEGLAGIKP